MSDLNLRALPDTILPPGSTSDELQAAVYAAASGDTIEISSDMPFTGAVIIPAGTNVTIQSGLGNNWVLSAPGAIIRHFEVGGSLTLQSITLDGGAIGGGIHINGGSLTMHAGAAIQNCTTDMHGGGIHMDGGSLTMHAGAAIQNCTANMNDSYSGYGGGLFGDNNANITMTGGKISGNNGDSGGGLYLTNAHFLMKDGEISNNTANSGGAMFLDIDSTFTMNDGKISNNTASAQGGAAYVYDSSVFTMTGGWISGNIAEEGNGGGLFVYRGAATITGESYITNNSIVEYGSGGGIFIMMMEEYNDVIIGNTVIFSCNRAPEPRHPPQDASTLYPNLQFASTSITDHVLNNYDIGPNFEDPIEETYHVTYLANGGSGRYVGPEILPGETDIVLSATETGISYAGHTFTGWNTARDGSGTAYAPSGTIPVGCSAVLFAQWVMEPVFYTVIYGGNGGSGSFVDPGRQYGTNYTILSPSQTGISYPGFTFTGWNTRPDGSGIAFAPGAILTITGNMALYAQWRQNPAPKKRRLCRASGMKCRISVEGQKIWVGDENSRDSRPPSMEIILLRDGKVYKRTNVDSAGDGAFAFCCLPKWKNSGNAYEYRIDEANVPDDYTKTIEGYNVVNTFTP